MNEHEQSPDRIIIQWTCGCAIYQDRTGKHYDQPGLLCEVIAPHREKVERTTVEGERYREGGGLFDA